MKKKIILSIIALIVAALCVLCIVFYVKQKKQQALIAQVPEIALQTPDGQTVNLAQITRGNVSVIFFFHPECAFCGMEMKEILAHKNELRDANLVFITTAEGGELTKFLEEYPIDAMPNSTVLIDHNRDFVITYNVKSPPTCYIYDKNQKLQKTIRGTVPVDDISQIIRGLQ
uniref:Thioredoxin domain-containing protein n=1 Tax=termite gut metagenome TaxID=433724 RepID=S0DFM3_9ZZZZ